MYYRSKDVGVMSELQNTVYKLSNGEVAEASHSWEFMRRYIVLDDLRNFLINEHLDGKLPYVPQYNPNLNIQDVDYMFVTLTDTKEEMDVFKAFVEATGITNYYHTSYTKNSGKKIALHASLTSVLASQIKTIKPKKIMIFDGAVAQALKLQSGLHIVQECFGAQCIATFSIVKMLMDDKSKHGAYKAHMWSDYTKLNTQS